MKIFSKNFQIVMWFRFRLTKSRIKTIGTLFRHVKIFQTGIINIFGDFCARFRTVSIDCVSGSDFGKVLAPDPNPEPELILAILML
jgi:hypothetical protein